MLKREEIIEKLKTVLKTFESAKERKNVRRLNHGEERAIEAIEETIKFLES